VTPCARLHTLPGAHAPGCTCTRECPEHEGHCPGCALVEAERGNLCGRCSRQLRGCLGAEEGMDPDHPVHGLPWAYDHLEDAYPSLSQASGNGGGSGPADREAQRLAVVLSVRADIHDVLASWVADVAEHGGLIGLSARVLRGLPARLRVARHAAWLLARVEALEAHPAVADAWEELGDLMSRAHALAPWRPAPTHLDGIPCRCGEMGLHDHGDEVKCWRCGHAYSREEYRVLTVILARRFKPEVQHA